MSKASLTDRSIEQVRTWIENTRASEARGGGAMPLARLARDPDAIAFIVEFIDLVIRPDDPHTAAGHLGRLSHHLPSFLSSAERLKLRAGGRFARMGPEFVQHRARKTLRDMVGQLVLDAHPDRLGTSIADLTRGGDRLNLNLLGEAVLGERQAARHLEQVIALTRRPDVDYVSVKVSSVASQLSLWSFDATVQRVVERLTALLTSAEMHGTFVNLDMEAYRDLDLTIAVFMRALDRFPELAAGIALQAYVPDSLARLQELHAWAAQRVADGGTPVKVRIVKGANLSLERVDSVLRGWPEPTWPTKAETDRHFKRMLRWALTPERTGCVRIGVATHNLFDLAYAWHLAGDRDVRQHLEFEALHGFDEGPMRAARKDVGPLRLYTPVVHEDEFDAALAYLVRRLQESAGTEHFLAALPELDQAGVFGREADRFVASIPEDTALDEAVPEPRRTQNRAAESHRRPDRFANTPDTDPSLAANRQWAANVASRFGTTTLGTATADGHRLCDRGALDSLVSAVVAGSQGWRERAPELRSWVLHQAGIALAHRRGDLVTVMAAETGKTFAEADTEVSEVVDFAHYYAGRALALHDVDGAHFTPSRLCVVVPPWNFPAAIPGGSTLAALAAGCGVILKPAPQSPRTAAVVAEALWEAGVPDDVLGLAIVDDGDLSQALITHPDVDRVVLTGSYPTAELFRGWRPELALMAETSGKNSIVVTTSADRDLAVADIVRSAFGNAGQKCSAASLVILVGAPEASGRLLAQLADATTSLAVDWPAELNSMVGPLIEPAHDPLLSGLTTLEPGESWLVEPRQLADQLWTPGIKLGVQPGSAGHASEYFGPLLGIMHAASLAEAIAWQNATPFGLTAGIHSVDADEVAWWLEHVEAGNLYVNRAITGAIVARQPFGGWKHSAVGPTAKAGGPNHVGHFGRWTAAPMQAAPDELTLSAAVAAMLERWSAHLDEPSMQFLRAAAASDQQAWETEFGCTHDDAGLGVERNLRRYLPTRVAIRSEGSNVHVARLQIAAVRAGAPVRISSAVPVPVGEHVTEPVEAWLRWVADAGPSRVRLVGLDARSVAVAVGGDPAIAVYGDEVTGAGPVELLAFVREQTVSITAHRYGSPARSFDRLLAPE